MSIFDPLRRYLGSKGASFTDAEFAVLAAAFTSASIPAQEFLQRAGEMATHAVFVASGLTRRTRVLA